MNTSLLDFDDTQDSPSEVSKVAVNLFLADQSRAVVHSRGIKLCTDKVILHTTKFHHVVKSIDGKRLYYIEI